MRKNMPHSISAAGFIALAVTAVFSAGATYAADNTATTYYRSMANKSIGNACSISYSTNDNGTVSYVAYDSAGLKSTGMLRSFSASTAAEVVRVMRKQCPRGCSSPDDTLVNYSYGRSITGSTPCSTAYNENGCLLADLATYKHFSSGATDTPACQQSDDLDANGCSDYTIHNSGWPFAVAWSGGASCIMVDATYGCAVSLLAAGETFMNGSCHIADATYHCNKNWLSTNYGAGYNYSSAHPTCGVTNAAGCAMASLPAARFYKVGDATCSTNYDSNGCNAAAGYRLSGANCVAGRSSAAPVSVYPKSYIAYSGG